MPSKAEDKGDWADDVPPSSGPKVSLARPSPPLEEATWQGEIRRVAIASRTFGHVEHIS